MTIKTTSDTEGLRSAARDALVFLLTINASYPETDALIARLRRAIHSNDPSQQEPTQ